MISPQPKPVLVLRKIQDKPSLWACPVCNTVYTLQKYICPFCELLHEYTTHKHKALQ